MSVPLQIGDPRVFSLVIPTFNGTAFLRRALDYFQRSAFTGQIVLSDNSAGEHRKFVAGCADAYKDLWIETHQFPEEIRFLDKMVATLERIESRFVMLHAHDDFMVPAAVERCVQFLLAHPDYVVARGRVAMFMLPRESNPPQAELTMSLVQHAMRGYEQPDPAERMLAHIENYASTFYSVHERKSLIESFRLTEVATKNVIFFQYLSSCLSALQGKIHCSDELFYVRQAHHDSWSGTLKRGSCEHWPMLITSPDFSRYYQQFRAALCEQVEHRTGRPAAELGARIDSAAIGLFRRGFCGLEGDNPAEDLFQQRLRDPATLDSQVLWSVVHYCVKHRKSRLAEG
jgi:glycosyltransferase domain-containing protein